MSLSLHASLSKVILIFVGLCSFKWRKEWFHTIDRYSAQSNEAKLRNHENASLKDS